MNFNSRSPVKKGPPGVPEERKRKSKRWKEKDKEKEKRENLADFGTCQHGVEKFGVHAV